ncbi:MAG: ATP-binding protein [Desulfuromonadales bacterium]
MAETTENSTTAAKLRRKAEEQVASQPTPTGELDAKRLLHELQVHQAELVMQNEELRRIIEEKSEHEAHLSNIINNTPAGYFRIDLEGRFLDVNDAWLRMHGYDSKDEVVGRHFNIVQVDSSSYTARAHMAELQKGKAIPYGEFESRRKDGSVGHHIFSAHPVVHFGAIAGFEWFIIDISERLDHENEKLLLQQQLQQAQKMESLGVLAGGIAHDFNNLLAIIVGHCSLAGMNTDRASEHIPPIELAANRAAALCRQMLAYAGKATFTLSQINMVELVNEMVLMLKATTNKNVAIKPDLSTDVPTISGDASQLRQIVMNLIINASEAIGEAQGVIQISLTKKAIEEGQAAKDHIGNIIPPGCYACLEVADTGCGMDDETKRRIFEPFYTTKFTGRGLGMSAVLGIISAHKGALQLTSQSGQGTTFTIYLPIESNIPTGDEASEQIASTLWQGSGRVLLVEDEDQVKLVAKAMLEALGFKVYDASNGREALDLYQNNSADINLVLTDIGMPIMDGYTLFRELKALSPELPIIISSGFGDTVVTTRIPVAQIAGLVSKPYRFDQLRDVLKGVVDGS